MYECSCGDGRCVGHGGGVLGAPGTLHMGLLVGLGTVGWSTDVAGDWPGPELVSKCARMAGILVGRGPVVDQAKASRARPVALSVQQRMHTNVLYG